MHDNQKMGSLLSFFAEHSPTIIKLLSVVVAIAATVLLYRVIFVQNVEASAEPAAGDLTDVNKKINEQKIEIETLKSENEASKGEIEKQRTEVYNLRQTIKEKETEFEAVKAENLQLKNQTDEAKKIDYEKHKSEVILSTSDENLVFQKEIAELKRRLSDYEIIAEDISDMQRLKEENERLKAQLGQSGGTAEPAESIAEKPADSAKVSGEPPAKEESFMVSGGKPAAEESIMVRGNSAAKPEESAATEGLSELTIEAIAKVAKEIADQSAIDTSVPLAAESESEPFRNPSADAPAEFVPNETTSVETEVLGPGPGDDVPNVDEILAEATKAAEPPAKKKKNSDSIAVVVETETLDGVSEIDKNLLDKFEKQKES